MPELAHPGVHDWIARLTAPPGGEFSEDGVTNDRGNGGDFGFDGELGIFFAEKVVR